MWPYIYQVQTTVVHIHFRNHLMLQVSLWLYSYCRINYTWNILEWYLISLAVSHQEYSWVYGNHESFFKSGYLYKSSRAIYCIKQVFLIITLKMSRYSSVSSENMPQAEKPGLNSRWGASMGFFLFATASKLALGPTQPPIQLVTGILFPEAKRPWRESSHSPSSTTDDSTNLMCHGVVLSWAMDASSRRGT
jgi:hypothetical protein